MQKKTDELVCKVAEEIWYVTRGLWIETWIGRCSISLSSFINISLNYYAWFFTTFFEHIIIYYPECSEVSIYGWQMHILLLCYFYLRHHLFHLLSSWSQLSRKMTELNRKLGIYTMCNWNSLTWNIRSKKCVLQHRPTSILACCASSCLGW